jgi:hypothetical protein
MLRDYLADLPVPLAYVLGKADALPESRALAKRAADDLERARRFVATLSPAHAAEVWNCMRLVLQVESMTTNELHARAARAGEGTIRGGMKSAQAQTASESERDRWPARFAELRARFPEAKKKVLGGMLESEFKTPWRTMRRYIKAR